MEPQYMQHSQLFLNNQPDWYWEGGKILKLKIIHFESFIEIQRMSGTQRPILIKISDEIIDDDGKKIKHSIDKLALIFVSATFFIKTLSMSCNMLK